MAGYSPFKEGLIAQLSPAAARDAVKAGRKNTHSLFGSTFFDTLRCFFCTGTRNFCSKSGISQARAGSTQSIR